MSARREPLGGGRWHFQHGPIDLVIGADGDPAGVAAAHEAAWTRFQGLLAELVGELPVLRRPIDASQAGNPPGDLAGPVARRMWQACAPFAAGGYITPMAAVAGSVAQELVQAYDRPGIARAWLNNGGDIALHLAPGHRLRVGVWADLARFDPALPGPLDGRFEVDAAMPVRGIATSGWRGRSFSLGVADAVTVLAATAAQADAAATIVANAVNADHPSIHRQPACALKDDTDLGAIPVTVAVGRLPVAVRSLALERGAACADSLRRRGLLHAAWLCCQGEARRVGPAGHAPMVGGSPGETPALELIQ